MLATSCDSFDTRVKNETADSTANVFYRDQSITASNAYSTFFLDSNDIEAYVRAEKVPDSIATHLRNFYSVRNFGFAWFDQDGLTEHGRIVYNLFNNEKKSLNDNLKKQVDSLMVGDTSTQLTDTATIAKAELEFTKQLFASGGDAFNDRISVTEFYFLVPAKKMDVLTLADSVLNDNSIGFQDNSPSNTQYSAMKEQLRKHVEAARKGESQPLSGKISKGSANGVSGLKQRLQFYGDYKGSDTSSVYNDSVQNAVKMFQKRHGFKETGIVDDSTMRLLNTPLKDRIATILINMERMKWQPAMEDSAHIQVNIPSFKLYAQGEDTSNFEMNVIVGKEGTNTAMFSGSINQIVFNPSWNIPQSIVRNEIMPAMKKNPNYLKSKNMEITNQRDSVPEIRQLPGKDNALGRVKFLFPNRYDIYLHDTPDKSAFNKSVRALSHGCIRVADAAKLSQFLLKDKSEWTPEKIKEAMNSTKEQTVKIDPVKVMITYYTAWIDESGNLVYGNDIYDLDKKAKERMFV